MVVSSIDTSTVPLHTSVAVRVAAAGTPPYATSTDAAGIPARVGAVVSTIAKVAEVVSLLLHSSVTVKITVTEPVEAQSSLNPFDVSS